MADIERVTAAPIVFADVLNTLARLGSLLGAVTDEQVPHSVQFLRQLETAVETASRMVRDRALLYLNVHGQQVTDKGTKEVELGGYRLRAVPMRTGLDPKKVEAMLRMKHIPPEMHMQSTIVYKVDEAKLSKLVESKQVNQVDLDACQYDKTYRVEVKQRGDK